MKRFSQCLYTALLSCLLLFTTGCHPVGDKSMSITVIYGATVVLSVIVLTVYCGLIRTKNLWFLLLFSSIPIVNIGYFWLSCSSTLESALWANRLSYLGSVFLPFSMLMIIFSVTKLPYRRFVPWMLLGFALIVFLIAASPGFSDIYYKEVSLSTFGGATTLNKVYGVLHPLYLFYLLGYFSAMIAAILIAGIKKMVASYAQAVLIAIAVFVNIGVWLGGQLVKIDFEFLSISYIISELFLLGLQYLIQETEQQPSPVPVQEEAQPDETDILQLFQRGIQELTRTEKRIYELYTEGKTTKDVLTELNITENTLKYHNKNLYSKLGVTSRKQLRELAVLLNGTP